MKKIYINPNMEIVKLHTTQMLAASPIDVTGENSLSSTSATGAALGHDDDFDW